MTTSQIAFHPEAAAEVKAAFTWYRARSVRAAVSFLKALEEALGAIAASPERWPLFAQGYRRNLLRRFPYAVVYRQISGGIEVMAVAHGRRRPGYWRSRLP
jgi:plasmid stabilization system protein ParE